MTGPDIYAPIRAARSKRDYRRVHIEGDSRAPVGMIAVPRRSFVQRVVMGLLR
jgi:hypothetical protein